MSKFSVPDHVVYLCTGSKCSKRGGKNCYKSLKSYIKESKFKEEIEIIRIECTDRCKFAPVLNLQPANVWLKEYSEKEAFKLLDEYVK